jgi:hypothetical protein
MDFVQDLLVAAGLVTGGILALAAYARFRSARS